MWRSGFIRCKSRDGPCGSHHDEARLAKWESSVGSTVEFAGSEGVSCWLKCGLEVEKLATDEDVRMRCWLLVLVLVIAGRKGKNERG